jgi:alcohol dehydrogenase
MADFFMPINNFIGENAITKLQNEIENKGYKKCLIITDSFMVNTDTFTQTLQILNNARVQFKIYDKTTPNPTISNVQEAFNLIRKDSADFIISIGGGSSHDNAKAVAIIATNGGCIRQYEGLNKLHTKSLPLVAINTTAGTASEMTYFCVITDEERHVKMVIVDTKMLSWISINDPLSMLSMPSSLTAATGVDALTHAIEAYVSLNSSPITDACSLHAIKLIKEHLPVATFNGQNYESRDMMANAQFLAGMAFSNASLGYVHAIAHQLGGIYNLPHGICNAVLLPYVTKFNGQTMNGSRMGDILEAFGKNVFNKQNKYSSQVLFKELIAFNKKLNIPTRLRDLGVRKEDFEKIAEFALLDGCACTNPVQTNKDGIVSILKNAY